MPFQIGNKLASGGARRGAGRPTNGMLAAKASFYDALIRLREEQGEILADRYYKMARRDPPTMRHLVDKVMPAAPTKVDIGINISRQSVVAILANEQGKAAALAVTKLLAERSKPIETTGENE